MSRRSRFNGKTMLVDRDVRAGKVYLSTRLGRRELGPWNSDNQMLDEAKRKVIRVVTPRPIRRIK